MATTVGTIPKPVRSVEGGTLRVGNTRVSLDSVVYAFNRGENAAEIHTLSLAEIHGAISYYLHNKSAVDKYLERRRLEFEKLRAQDHARPDHISREMLLARKKDSDKTGRK